MAEKRTIELEIQDNSKTLKQQYKEAVSELQKMVVAYGEMSDEAVAAAKRAAELKDQIEDTNDLMKSFKGEGAFIAMNKAMTAVASGFSAVEGGLALVGVEGEAVQQTMLKVQAAMALAQGLEGLEDAGRAFKNLGVTAANALKGIRTGIAATGIGVLVVAVGTLVAYWDDIKEAVSGVSDEQTKLNKKTEANLKASEEKVSALDKQDNILKLQGKTEKQILQYKIQELDKAIKIAEVNLENQKATKKAQVEAAKRNEQILLGIINFISAPLQLLLSGIDKIAEFAGVDSSLGKWFEGVKKSAANLIFDPNETAKEGDEAIKAASEKLTELKNQQAGYQLAIQQIDKEAAQKSVNTEKATAQEKINITRQLEEEKNRIMEDSRAKDLDAIRIKYKYDKEEAEKNLKDKKLTQADFDKLIAQQTESRRADEKGINDKWDKLEKDARDKKLEEQIKAEDAAWLELQKAKNSQREQELLDLQLAYDAKIEAANGNAEIEKAITEKFNKDAAAINEKYRKEEEEKQKEQDAKDLARKRKKEEMVLMSIKDSLQIASDLTQLFAGKSEAQQKKAFMIQKGINIANATVDTYKAATSALRDYPSPFNYIAMAAAITAGLLNIKKIKETQFGTGGGGGGNNAPAGANAPAPMTANFSTIGSSGINQLATLQQKPTQAYVVSGEVTSAQALDRNRVQNATL